MTLQDKKPSAELELYRLELEVQNQELNSSRQILEETLDLYANLYDFAAVACMTLSQSGVILELNLTGSRLLKIDRDKGIGIPLSAFLHADSKFSFLSHLTKCKQGARVSSRLKLAESAGASEILLISVGAQPPGSHRAVQIDHDENELPYYPSSMVEFSDFGQS
jgi:hypothetical protein